MISLDLMKSSEVRKAGNRSIYYIFLDFRPPFVLHELVQTDVASEVRPAGIFGTLLSVCVPISLMTTKELVCVKLDQTKIVNKLSYDRKFKKPRSF